MFAKLRFSITTQLIVIIFISIISVAFTITAMFTYWMSKERMAKALDVSETAIAILAQDFVRGIILKSPDVVVDMTRKLQAFDSIMQAEFITTESVPILIYAKKDEMMNIRKGIPNETIAEMDNLLQVQLPIKYQNKIFGNAYFVFSKHEFEKKYVSFLKKMYIFVPLFLLISFLIALYFQRYITAPILKLSSSFDSLGQNGEVEKLEKSYASKEIKSLYKGFDQMVQRIQDASKLLSEEREKYFITLESIADGVIATDNQGIISYINPSAEEITGWTKKHALGKLAKDVYRLLDEESETSLTNQIDQALLTGRVHFSMEKTALLNKVGDKLAIQSSISPMRSADEHITGAVIVFQNVTESRKMSHELRHQATHDPLTQLINRPEFERLISHELKYTEHPSSHVLLYLDLDQFKVVNDTSGHTAGDSLLIQVATIVRQIVRDTDVVARLGGDEFAVFLPNCSEDQGLEIAEKIRIAISEFVFVWGEKHFRIGVSIGVVPFIPPYMGYGEILQSADLSCYAAKDQGRNRVHVFREKDTELKKRYGEMKWVGLIHDGLEENNFSLYVQKILPIKPFLKSQRIEILVRYVNKQGEIKTPNNFLPAAERYMLASTLDRWVILRILTDEQLLIRLRSDPLLHLNINLSGLTIGESDFVDFVLNLYLKASIPKKTICFEITETAAVSNLAATSHFMRSVRLQGCEFALDDFGIGVSSFAYLKNLPVDYLKIDGSFIRDIYKNPVNEAMVKAINNVGHVMNIQTIAEFVENKAIFKKLQDMNVDYAQGFYIHKPCPLLDYMAFDFSKQVTHT